MPRDGRVFADSVSIKGMVLTRDIHNLRRKLQDFYDRNGNQLTDAQQAFHDDELIALLEDSFAEATAGSATSSSADALQRAKAILLARVDGLLMIAQDEGRRVKWSLNNKVVDPSMVAGNLVKVANELRGRYDKMADRELTREVEGVENRNSGGRMDLSSTNQPHINRNFNNSVVKRNKPFGHY